MMWHSFVSVLMALLAVSSAVYAGTGDCPNGQVDCPCLCGMYVDEDADRICDHSYPSSGTETALIGEDEGAALTGSSSRLTGFAITPITIGAIVLVMAFVVFLFFRLINK